MECAVRCGADRERLWARMQTTQKPVGQVLMDQACVAGVGNIFRAEILFRARLHPDQPANTVGRGVKQVREGPKVPCPS